MAGLEDSGPVSGLGPRTQISQESPQVPIEKTTVDARNPTLPIIRNIP